MPTVTLDNHPHPLQTHTLKESYDSIDAECHPLLEEVSSFDFNPGLKSHLRKLHSFMSQLAEIIEKYVQSKYEKDYHEKENAKRNVSNIQSYTGWQGYSHIAGGIGALLLSRIGASELSAQGVAAFDKIVESWKQKDQFEESLFLQLSSSERQALEGIKNLPQNLQQLIMRLHDMEKEAIRQTGQR